MLHKYKTEITGKTPCKIRTRECSFGPGTNVTGDILVIIDENTCQIILRSFLSFHNNLQAVHCQVMHNKIKIQKYVYTLY